MRYSDFTKEGGFPFDQNALDFMQKAYYEIVNALLSHFTLDPAVNYIISGCEVSGSTITKGWMIINSKLLYFEGGSGSINSKIKVDTAVTPLTFQNGNTNDTYTYSKVVLDASGIALNTFIRVPNANEFLTSLPNATETQRGIAEIATQAETNTGTDDVRFITPKKLAIAIPILAPQSPQATETIKGIAEIATQTEVNAGTDNTRFITPKKLKNYNFQSIKVTKGMLTTGNRHTGTNAVWMFNDFSVNRAYVYPPSGFTIYNLKGIIASIDFGGDVNGDDSLYCRHQVQYSSNRIAVIAQNTENRAVSRINYLAIWQK